MISYKFYPEYFNYHKVPERLIEEELEYFYNHRPRWYALILFSDHPIPEKLLYKVLSYSQWDNFVKTFFYHQNFSKQFFLDQFDKFNNCKSLTSGWNGKNITIYHLLEMKPYQPWFDDFELDHTQLQKDLLNKGIDIDKILRPTQEVQDFIKLSTL